MTAKLETTVTTPASLGIVNAPAYQKVAADQPDLSYRAVDDMFTAFYPNTPSGEDAWREMAAQNGGDGKILSIHAADVARQLRESGYTVSEAATGDSSSADDAALLAELASA
jgi:hypothetical protein